MSADDSTTQIRLPGQAHVAEGPHDQTGMYLMHHAFRRDLAAFETAVRVRRSHDEETWRALAAPLGPLRRVLHHHHAVEDASHLAAAAERGSARADGLRSSRRWQAEHDEIDPALAASTAALRRHGRAPLRGSP